MKTLIAVGAAVLSLALNQNVLAEYSKGDHYSWPDVRNPYTRTFVNEKTETSLIQNEFTKTTMAEHMGAVYRSLRKMQYASLEGDQEATRQYAEEAVFEFNNAHFDKKVQATAVQLVGKNGVRFLDASGQTVKHSLTQVSDYNRLELFVTQKKLAKNTQNDYLVSPDGSVVRTSDGRVIHKGQYQFNGAVEVRKAHLPPPSSVR